MFQKNYFFFTNLSFLMLVKKVQLLVCLSMYDLLLSPNIKGTLMQIWNFTIFSGSFKNNTLKISHYWS